jgi:hypothetical protein
VIDWFRPKALACGRMLLVEAKLDTTVWSTMKTIRLPSRLIPSRNDERRIFPIVLVVSALILGFGYFVYSSSSLVRCVTAFLFLAFCGSVTVMNRREKQRLEVIASSRENESICEFARSFNTRQTDTWIIRAAHREIQLLLHSHMAHFPVRGFDSLLNDLRMDSDDVEDLFLCIAGRCGRSLAETEYNPYYGNVQTVSDLVLFINAQPRITTV